MYGKQCWQKQCITFNLASFILKCFGLCCLKLIFFWKQENLAVRETLPNSNEDRLAAKISVLCHSGFP